MKKVILKGEGVIAVEEAPLPKVKEGWALIRVNTSAVCGSERGLYLMKNAPAMNIGHEISGVVEQVNGTKVIQPGDRVAANVMQGCGECWYCKNGLPTLCRSSKFHGNGHAEYMALPEECCLPLPEEMSFEEGVLLGGDTIGVAWRCMKKLLDTLPASAAAGEESAAKPGEEKLPDRVKKALNGRLVFVSGLGPVGLGVVMMLKFLGCRIVVSEFNAFRRDMAKENLGADVVLDPGSQDVKAELDALTEGLGPEIVIECSGAGAAQQQALDLVCCQGVVVFAGENFKEISVNPSNQIIHKEITVTGAFYYTPSDFLEIQELFRQGLRASGIVSHRFRGEEAPAAFDLFFKEGNSGKVMLQWEGSV